MKRLRAVWSALRTGLTYADGYAHRQQDDELVDKALARFAVATAVDHLAARVAVENFPLGKPRLTLVGSAS
jgi:hypothetical protein